MTHLYILFGRRQKVSKAHVRLHDLCDDEIYQTTRFPRAAVQELCELVREDVVRPTQRSNAIPVDTQMLAALQFYASGSFQWVIGRSCGLSQPSVCLSVDGITKALVKLAPDFIKFPADQATVVKNKLNFHAVAGFPNVIGAIDCTHVAIKAPSVNEEAFVNRKGIHTINVQAVCDNDMKLLNVVAKWPGSSHDAFIWRSCSLRDLFQQGCVPDGWLIGEYHMLQPIVIIVDYVGIKCHCKFCETSL